MQDLLVRQFGVPKHGTSTLNGFDDFARLVASKCEACCVRINLHCASKCLLSSCRHTVRLIQNDNLVSSRWESNLFLCKRLDLVPDHVNATINEDSQRTVRKKGHVNKERKQKGLRLESNNSPIVRGVQFQDTFLEGWSQELMSQAEYTRSLSDTRRSLGP